MRLISIGVTLVVGAYTGLTLHGGRNAQAEERAPTGRAIPLADTPVDFIPLPDRPPIRPVIDCGGLATSNFSGVPSAATTINSAQVEAARPGRAEFCLVKGVVAPAIQFELRLPTNGYTGRYLQGGCGGTCGVIPTSVTPTCDNKTAFGGAFAVGFENSGHVSSSPNWALDEEARVDYAYRAAHAFSVAAKSIIAAYYGQRPAFSYFQGCSNGGREGMIESQRYPTDFNGIISGSPAAYIAEAMERFIWEAKWGHDANGRATFDMAAVGLLHRAVVAACDHLDGVTDGQIDDPRVCRFDPARLSCKHVGETGCLTPAQVEAARRFYEGPTDAKGRHLYFGGDPYGSELTWVPGFAEAGLRMMEEGVRSMIFKGQLPADVTVRTWQFDGERLNELSRRGAIFDAPDTDLTPFKAAGGKLLLWHGAADAPAGMYAVPNYYQRLQKTMGGRARTHDFARFFLIPGVYHCANGYVPYEEDLLGAMVAWVEKGAAPDRIVATAVLKDGAIRRRPIYPYPTRAHYNGSGDINAVASFGPAEPSPAVDDRYRWIGRPAPRS